MISPPSAMVKSRLPCYVQRTRFVDEQRLKAVVAVEEEVLLPVDHHDINDVG